MERQLENDVFPPERSKVSFYSISIIFVSLNGWRFPAVQNKLFGLLNEKVGLFSCSCCFFL